MHPYLPDTGDDEVGRVCVWGWGRAKGCAQSRACVQERHTLCMQMDEGQQARLRDRALAAVDPWLHRFDAVVLGPGLGRDPLVLSTVAEVRVGRSSRRGGALCVCVPGAASPPHVTPRRSCACCVGWARPW